MYCICSAAVWQLFIKDFDWLIDCVASADLIFVRERLCPRPRVPVLVCTMRWRCGRTCRCSCLRRSTRGCRCLTATRARGSAVTGFTCSARLVSGVTSTSDGARSLDASYARRTCVRRAASPATTSMRSTIAGSRCTSECSGTTAAASPSNLSNISTISSNSSGQVNHVKVAHRPKKWKVRALRRSNNRTV